MKRTNKTILYLCIFSLVVSILIILGVNYNYFSLLDNHVNYIFSLINSNFILINISKVINSVFDTGGMMLITLVFCIFIWYRFPKQKKLAIFFAFSMIIGAIVMMILKSITNVNRPLNALLIENTQSFPSGHALTSLVFFGLICYIIFSKNRKWFNICCILSLIVVLIISISRLILNVHWFSDIIGGWTLGLFVLTGCIWIYEKVEKGIRF